MKRWLCISLTSVLLLATLSSPALALTYSELNQEIKNFEQSGQARFVPLGMKKVIAYQGAAMLIYDQSGSAFADKPQDNQALNSAIEQAHSVLMETQNNANIFFKKNAALLALETEANKALVYHHQPQLVAKPEVQTLFDDAKQILQTAIVASEKGQFNQLVQSVKLATMKFNACIDIAMPGVVEETKHALSRASSAGAEKYAPVLWQRAKQAFEALQTYHESLSNPESNTVRPEHIGYAFEMAVYAQKMAIQVKEWRYDNGSHESLVLAAIDHRLGMAKALNIDIDYHRVDADIEYDQIITAIKALQQTLNEERRSHALQMRNIEQSASERLNATLLAQRRQDQQDFQSKLSTIKTAFNSKLEQETFEKNRQKKLQELFHAGEVDMIVHLDGSLVIRVKKIQFAPNTTKIESKYFDLLSRIKEGLQMYPERGIKIEGHTDSIGDEKINQMVSLQRAESVQEYLIAAGIEATRIKAFGFGEVKPIATNTYEQGRTINRRIDIVIEKP